jgi:dolichol-phosphate mannosyltransferase
MGTAQPTTANPYHTEQPQEISIASLRSVGSPQMISSTVSDGIELSIVVPTFNERDNIQELIARLSACLENVAWEVIFVDDDSPDGTAEVVRAIARTDGRVRCLQRIGRRGLASACVEGMLSSSAPYLAVIDADMQHDETLLPHMLSLLRQGGIDIIVGSRYVAGGSLGQLTKARTLLSRAATKLSQVCLRVNLADPMSGFFMMARETLHNTVHRLSATGFKILLDICASSPKPLRSRELSYEFRRRFSGESKLDGQVAWEYLMLLLDKLIGHIIPVRFISFAMVGGVGVVVHFMALALLFGWLQMSFLVGETFATVIAMCNNFVLNNVLTYRDMRLRGWNFVRGWLSFMLICSVGAFANVGIAAYLFQNRTDWRLSALAGVLVGTVWSYAITSVYTWTQPAALRS